MGRQACNNCSKPFELDFHPLKRFPLYRVAPEHAFSSFFSRFLFEKYIISIGKGSD